MRERFHWEPLWYPLLLATALILRILQLGAFVTTGELTWTFRALKFWQAPAAAPGGPAGTVTLWVSSLGLGLARLAGDSGPLLNWQELGALGAFDAQNLAQVRLVASLWPAAKLPVAVANSIVVVMVAFLAARLWGGRAGLFAGALLTVTPYHLALSRAMLPGALSAGLAVSALLALLWALRDPRGWGALVLSGVLAGLAALDQSLCALLLPYGLLLVAVAHLAGRRSPLLWLRNSAVWTAAALAVAVAAYPRTWVAPSEALRALGAHVGAVWASGDSWAPLGLAATPVVLAGLLAAAGQWPWEERRQRMSTVAVAAFAVAFLLLDRSPGWPLVSVVALVTLAAAGLGRVPDTVRRLARLRGWRLSPWASLALSALLLAAIGWETRAILRYHPYYPAYRNPWWSPSSSVELGSGEGLDRAATYLNRETGAQRACVATVDVAAFAPFFVGETVPLTESSLATADYVVLYNRDWLGSHPLTDRLGPASPTYTVRLHGIEYARVYANRVHEPVLRALDGQVRRDDAVLVDAPSPLARHYRGPAPLEEIGVESAEQAAQKLTTLASGRWRIWHVAFDGADPEHIVQNLLETGAMLASRETAPGVVISTYVLPLQPRFRALAPGKEVGLEFTGGLRLEQSGVAETRVQYRQRIGLALAWRAGQKPAGNVALSLRLVDAQGRQWAQRDEWIVDLGGRSTAGWQSGESLRSHHILDMPPALPPGPYRLRLVLYMADSLEPLLPVDPGGPRSSPEVELYSLEVLPAQLPPTVEELRLAHPLQVALANGAELLGCELGAERVQAGQELALKLWWRITEPVTVTYRAHLMLLDADGNQRADAVVELAGAQHPTTAWTRGEVIEGRYRLALDPEAAAGEAILGVELVDPQGPVGKPVQVGSVQVERLKHVFQVPPMQQPRQETLDQKVRLLGYDLEPATLKPGGMLRLTLYWQALAPMKVSYTVFTHLLDPSGEMRAGHDGIPENGTRPTTGWVLHEVLADRHEIALPAGLVPGRYAIEVGLYDAASGARLPASDSSGAPLQHDRILLGEVTIQ